VITFAGSPESVVESAVRAAAKATELIDLNHHGGVHPRLGALDVLPFIPLGEATLEDCVELAHREASATRSDRIKLENVRRSQFEGLRKSALSDEPKRPDIGGPGLHATAGAVIVGARKILIAFNINLRTADLELANAIAKRIRASSGGLPAVKALGLPLSSRGLVQVSINLTDFEQTPMQRVYEEVAHLAAVYGAEVEETELIGLVPRKALEVSTAGLMKIVDFDSQRFIEDRLETLL